ncbi:hypothetical protein KI387_005888, partial [Taxus chinensis]
LDRWGKERKLCMQKRSLLPRKPRRQEKINQRRVRRGTGVIALKNCPNLGKLEDFTKWIL